jgi:hypothetical protein
VTYRPILPIRQIQYGLRKYRPVAEESKWELSALARQAEQVQKDRARAYPEIGDIIDALFKKEAGDSTEWDGLAIQRATVKAQFPKA